ncbi:MAG: CotH kinase family protein [Bacteroidaceae bacterium]|nr:CotH kinase family protein [Bacteroidaceae bacterium]
MKKFLLLIAFCLSCFSTTMAGSWVPPTLRIRTGLPPTNTELYFYNVSQEMFLTKGTTWGSHAALTESYEGALPYFIYEGDGYFRIYSPNAGGTGYLFNAETGVDIYTDYGVSSNPVECSYWDFILLSGGVFHIVISEQNNWYSQRPGYCIGWDPDNIDVDNNKNYLWTNIGLFSIEPSRASTCGLDWKYVLSSDARVYEARFQLYDMIQTAEQMGVSTDDVSDVYNYSTSVSEINATTKMLSQRIEDSLGTNADMTFAVTNPNFDNNASGWTVYMPGGQNNGFQGASYSGSATISNFVETWIPTPRTLGSGSVFQTLYGLPEGTYKLEVDAVAVNQNSNTPATGVVLFAESNETYEEAIATYDRSPQHFECMFYLSGSEVNIGVRTSSSTTANWMAFDNVRLTYYGTSDATSVTMNSRDLSMVLGETITLTATVNASNEWLNHVTWSSSNPSVATVDENGKVTALAKGSATIRATAFASECYGQVQVSVTTSDPSGLTINEIQVANIDQFIDPSFNYGGWVEFYNPKDVGISLSNFYVSDDPSNLRKFQLPIDAGAVPAKGFKCIWFDHHDQKGGTQFSSEAYKQVDFKLTYEGGVIYVSDSEGNLLLSQAYPAAVQRASYARRADGTGTWSYTGTPTPEASNVGSTFAAVQLEAPVVDRDATVFSSGFTVKVTIPSGATLRYTTDGSTPTLDNGMTSTTGSFQVSTGQSAIYRFRLFKSGYLPSAVVTRSYIYQDKAYYLPIVSVVTDQDNLYDNTIGAYTDGTNGTSGNNKNFSNKNRGWERPVNFEYLVPDDGGSFIMALNQECDFEVCGGWTRHYDPASSFRLKGNKYYLGQNFLPYPFFEEKPYIKNKTIVVRNGGNDNWARLQDAATHEIILKSGFHVDCQATQPAHIFINGQYRFMFNLREPNNKNHGYANYGIDTDEMDQFEINGSVGYEQKEGDDQVFRQWMTLAQQLANDPSNDDIYAQICNIVDIDEYCNYMAAEVYIGCGDWLTNSNNVKGYRSKADGKYHLVFMDLDSGFGSTNMIGELSGRLYDSRYDTGKNFLIDIFLNMLKYAPFQKKFIDAFCLVNGSVFESSRVTSIINAMRDRAYTALGFDGQAGTLSNKASSLISAINSSSNRSNRMNSIYNYFGLKSYSRYTVNLSSNVEGAVLMLNGEEVPTGKFDGQLFAPAVLTAKAPAGYRFLGWQQQGSGSVTNLQTVFDTSTSWNYYDQGSLDGQSWKTRNYRTTSWKSGNGPLGYGNVGINGSQDYATTLSYGSDSNNKRPTYYFRKSFNLSTAPTDNDVFQLTYYVDDGFIAYVNGTEIGRYHMPDGDATYSTYSTTYEGATAATATITIPNNLLVRGSNVIAVEVHNTSATSSDIYWGAILQRGTLSSGSFVSTSEQLDITTLTSNTATLIATYEKLSDDQLLAHIATPVKVNEVSAANTVFINDQFKKNDWVELYNPTETDLNVAGLFISDDIDEPLKYQIPTGSVANTVIPANGHLVVWADQLAPTTQLHSSFKLSNTKGQMVLVTSSDDFANNNAAFFANHPALRDFADGLPYDAHRGDQSVGRFPDGGNELYLMERPTIERTNSLRTYDIHTGTDTGIMDTTSTLTLALAQGWNWVSHPMKDAYSVNIFKDNADRILSQTLEAYYNSVSKTMEGLLKNVAASSLYKFQMNAAKTYELDGIVPRKLAPTSLRAGWNWLGYPATGTQTLESALRGSKVEEGDMLMGQNGFSVYSSTDGWVGTLSSFVPGMGYMYKSVSTKSVRFNSTTSSLKLRRHLSPAKAADAEFDRHAYPNVMGVIAQLQMDGHALDCAFFRVKAYADGECRGVGEYVDGRVFMTLYGLGGERLTFKAFSEDGEVFNVRETLDFTSDVLGTRSAPILLSLSADNTPTAIAATGTATSSVAVGYYSLSGLFLGNTADHLRPGIYVARLAGGQCTKVLIR